MSEMTTATAPPPVAKRDGAAQHARYCENDFPALRLARSGRATRRLGSVLIWILGATATTLLFAPWQQSIRGRGEVVALDPFERPQEVQAPVKGRIAARGEGIIEGAFVEKGQLLFRIEDQDPLKLMQLQTQVFNAELELTTAEARMREAEGLKRNSEQIVAITGRQLDEERRAQSQLLEANEAFVAQAKNKLAAEKQKLRASEAKAVQVKLDFDRKTALLADGLASGLEQQKLERDYQAAQADVRIATENVASAVSGVEGKERERDSKQAEWDAKVQKTMSEQEKARAAVKKAEIDIKKTSEEIQQKKNKIEELKSKERQQKTQEVVAPRDGYVFDLAVFEEGSIIKVGDALCRIVPRMTDPAVQVWVAGNDVPLIHEGDHVRLQFEGWPAVQFVGWPSVAVGSFGGVVNIVDATDDGTGMFRIVVLPDETDDEWPEHPYLRQGVRTQGWVLLDQVPLWYEVWRRMNGFPPVLDAKSGDKSKDAKPPKIKI